ncbi:hypothetical protein BGZ96_005150 [Linnemannia gamsii]|uniref:LysM domain-containing protein n=1 Tax=Linnemannia gamsii TaxID=64522 RepID=A0ABQ7KEM1_9FUNG|nr:hypothetical protein BGZ96_005150 [Linnemannia gamsii]
MLQVRSTSHHPNLNGFLSNLTAKNTDRPGLIPGPGIDRRNVILSSTSASSPIAPVSPFHQTKRDKEDLMHHPLGITADHGPPPDNLDHDDATTTLRGVSNNTPERTHRHRQLQQDDSRLAIRAASGLVLDHDPLSTDNNNYNTSTRIERSSGNSSNDTISNLSYSTPKVKPLSQPSRKQEVAATGTPESSQQPPQPTERAVARSFDPLLQPVDSDRRPHLSSSNKRSPTAPPSFSSNRTTAKQSLLEHLPGMGPLEMERGIDSGVVLIQDMSSLPVINNVRRISTSDSVSDSFIRDPSISTLASGISTLSSHATLTGQGRPDTDHGIEGSSWSGDHPLLFDYTAEPESIDDDSYHSHGLSSSHPHDSLTVSRHKGHTLSLGITQESTPLHGSEISFFASGSSARRRRNGPKGLEERSWTSHTDKDRDQKQYSGLEPGGKRVIIHQVTTADTLAGIALNYGIQVSV